MYSQEDIEWDTSVMGFETTVTINYEVEWSGHRADDPEFSIDSIEVYGVAIPHDRLPSDVIERAMQEVREFEESKIVDDAMAGYEARRDEDLTH